MGVMSVAVRLATESELVAVRFIGFATWPQTYAPIAGVDYVVSGLDEYWNAESIRAAIRSGNIYIALDSDEVVGMSEVAMLNGDLVMWKLYVLPGRQRSGVGRALLDAVKQRAANENKSLLTEYVAANTRAGSFYRSQGFIELKPPASPLDSVWLRLPRHPG